MVVGLSKLASQTGSAAVRFSANPFHSHEPVWAGTSAFSAAATNRQFGFANAGYVVAGAASGCLLLGAMPIEVGENIIASEKSPKSFAGRPRNPQHHWSWISG
jgi:hypothetical protein